MRRSVEEAIRVVRQTFSGPYADRPGPAWEYAKTLADEVERLHARLGTAPAGVSRGWLLNQLAGMRFPEQGGAHAHMVRCLAASDKVDREQ